MSVKARFSLVGHEVDLWIVIFLFILMILLLLITIFQENGKLVFSLLG